MRQRRTGVTPLYSATLDQMYARRYRRQSKRGRLVLTVVLVAGLLGGSAVWTNAFGAGDRFERLVERIELAVDPPPNRPTRKTITVTPRPVLGANPGKDTPPPAELAPAEESTDPEATASSKARSPRPSSPSPEPTPSPEPVRRAVDVDLLDNPEQMFTSQLTEKWCAPAGVQMTLAVLGLGDSSEEFQREIINRTDEFESWEDSHNGSWGPAAMADALAAYGADEYEIRAYQTRADALRDSAIAIKTTGKPVVLLAWRGAHTWVMTGYRANADPTIFDNATIKGAYILDPWYPRVSSIWGPSDPPGTFQDAAEMERNILAWKRPEGAYPDRDGKFIALVPTTPAEPGD
ncbi:MAG: hypothetical protein ACR2JZ_06095 [Candidatus Limnocylindrales bacterium]